MVNDSNDELYTIVERDILVIKYVELYKTRSDVSYAHLSWKEAKSNFNLYDYKLVNKYKVTLIVPYDQSVSDRCVINRFCSMCNYNKSQGVKKENCNVGISDLIVINNNYYYVDINGFKLISNQLSNIKKV